MRHPTLMNEWLIEVIRLINHAVASKASAYSKKEFRECFLTHHVHEFYNDDTYMGMVAPKRYLTNAIADALHNAHMKHPELSGYGGEFSVSAMISDTNVVKETYSVADRIARFIKCEIEKARDAYRSLLNSVRGSKQDIQKEDKYRFFSELTTSALQHLFYCEYSTLLSKCVYPLLPFRPAILISLLIVIGSCGLTIDANTRSGNRTIVGAIKVLIATMIRYKSTFSIRSKHTSQFIFVRSELVIRVRTLFKNLKDVVNGTNYKCQNDPNDTTCNAL